MSAYIISSLLTCVISFILTSFVLYKSPNRSIRRIYALYSTSISKEDLTKIFDPFFTKKRTGMGLGLAVSHQIIKSHAGMIQVESEEGKGTIFYVYLPKKS